tara:strand:- start:1941 stop:2276 length:336 start_codon:yes stop_codon:yes gene_type:complete
LTLSLLNHNHPQEINMSNKVVINACYGGFSLSEAAEELMMEHFGEDFDYYNHPRHCPKLVEVVEALGKSAGGSGSCLTVVQLCHGDRYIVNEYDGWESISEPEDIKWVVVQ